MVVEQDGCTKTVAETAADGSTIRGKGFGQRPSPNRGRNHDGEDRRVKSAKDGGVTLRRGAHEAELGDVISEVVSRSGRVARPLEFPSLTKRMAEDLDG